MVRRRKIIISSLVIFSVITIYSFSWFLFASFLIRNGENWANNQAKSGWVINFNDIQTKGFPSLPKFVIKEIKVESPYIKNLVWYKDEILITPSIYKPIKLEIEASGMSLLENKVNDTIIVYININKTLINIIKKNKDLNLIFSAEAIEIKNNSNQPSTNIGLLTLEQKKNYGSKNNKQENQSHDIVLKQNIKISNVKFGIFNDLEYSGIKNNLQIKWSLKDKIKRKKKTNLYEIINDLSKNKSRIEIEEMLVEWEPFKIVVNGEIAFDKNLQPVSFLKVSIRGTNQFIGFLEDNNGLDNGLSMTTKFIISLLPQSSYKREEDTIETTVEIKNQKLWIGSLEVSSIPKLYWQ